MDKATQRSIRYGMVAGLCLALGLPANGLAGAADTYCRFLTDIRLKDSIAAGAGGYFVGAGIPVGKPAPGETCEASLASTESRKIPKGHWALLKDTTPASDKLGETFIARITLHLDSDLLLEPSTVQCTRESPNAAPAPWTPEELKARVSSFLECQEEPAFEGTKRRLSECKIRLNHWQVAIRLGNPVPAEELRQFREEARAFALEVGVKCPGHVQVPSCFRARELLDCMKEIEGILPSHAVTDTSARPAREAPSSPASGSESGSPGAAPARSPRH